MTYRHERAARRAAQDCPDEQGALDAGWLQLRAQRDAEDAAEQDARRADHEDIYEERHRATWHRRAPQPRRASELPPLERWSVKMARLRADRAAIQAARKETK